MSVFPPLNIFKTSTTEQINEVFKVSGTNLVVKNLVYNSITEQLEVEGEYIVGILFS